MRWYEIEKECKQCGEYFNASRQDAKFCGSNCRTASHRAKKKREEAEAQTMTQWDKLTRRTYEALLIEHPAIKTAILNHAAAYGMEAAGEAAKIAYSVTSSTIQRMEKRLKEKDEVIEILRNS